VVNALTLEVIGWAAAFALTLAFLFVGAAWVRSRNERRRAAERRDVLTRYIADLEATREVRQSWWMRDALENEAARARDALQRGDQ
jgi:hypothetical protein